MFRDFGLQLNHAKDGLFRSDQICFSRALSLTSGSN